MSCRAHQCCRAGALRRPSQQGRISFGPRQPHQGNSVSCKEGLAAPFLRPHSVSRRGPRTHCAAYSRIFCTADREQTKYIFSSTYMLSFVQWHIKLQLILQVMYCTVQYHRCLTIEAYSAQALCIEDELAAGQCNPLYDDAALRAKAGLWVCPAQASASASPAASHDRSALHISPWAPQDAAIMEQAQHEGAHSSSAGNASSLRTELLADVEPNNGAHPNGAVMGAQPILLELHRFWLW